MNPKRLDQIVDQFEKNQLPKSFNQDDEDMIKLIQDIKISGLKNLEPDTDFVNKFALKIEKGGEYHMWIWEKIKATPLLFSGLAVLLLIFIVNSLKFSLLPFDILRSQPKTSSVGVSSVSDSGVVSSYPGGMGMQKMIAREIMPPQDYYPGNEDVNSIDRSVVRSANLDLEVKQVSQSIQKASDQIKANGGLIINSNINNTDNGYNGYLNARVPEENLDKTVQFLRELAVEVKVENVSSYDQTGQVVDVANTIEDLGKQVSRYEELLKQATTTDEKYNLQNQIDSLQRQIQQYQRQQTDLKGRERMSQLSVSFQEQQFAIPFLKDMGFSPIFRDAFYALKETVRSLLVVAIWVIVFCPIWLPIYFLVKKKNGK